MQSFIAFVSTATGMSFPVIVLFFMAFVVYALYGLITGKGMTVNFGKINFGLTFNKKPSDIKVDDPVKTENFPTCDKCINKDLFVEKSKHIVLNNTDDVNNLRKDLILQQMNYAEEKISELRILICKQYSKQLALKNGIGIISAKETRDYKFYRMLIYYILLSKVKDNIIKKALKENHFLDLTNIEFDQYVLRKVDLILDTLTEGLDTYYTDDLSITREELFMINESILSETKSILKYIFENARNITEDYNAKMIFLKSEMTKQLNDI